MKSGDPASPKATIGLPLVLNMYEQLPFWKTFFNSLGFKVIISDESTRDMYFKGQHTIPSDTVCYPAKLAHGHVVDLLEKKADIIFYPCQTYNIDEGHSDNNYNCPVVAYYPELLKANIPELTEENFSILTLILTLKSTSRRLYPRRSESMTLTKRKSRLHMRQVWRLWTASTTISKQRARR